MKKIRFVWRYVRPYRYQFVLILLDVAVYSLFMLAAPLIISWMIDNVIKGVPFDNAFYSSWWIWQAVWRRCSLICGLVPRWSWEAI